MRGMLKKHLNNPKAALNAGFSPSYSYLCRLKTDPKDQSISLVAVADFLNEYNKAPCVPFLPN